MRRHTALHARSCPQKAPPPRASRLWESASRRKGDQGGGWKRLDMHAMGGLPWRYPGVALLAGEHTFNVLEIITDSLSWEEGAVAVQGGAARACAVWGVRA